MFFSKAFTLILLVLDILFSVLKWGYDGCKKLYKSPISEFLLSRNAFEVFVSGTIIVMRMQRDAMQADFFSYIKSFYQLGIDETLL